MSESNKKRFPGFLDKIFFVIIGAAITLGTISLTSYWAQVEEKAKISNFVNGCIQDDIDRIQKEVELLSSFLPRPVKQRLSESFFLWQHESVLIQTISDQIGALDISIVKKFNNYVIMINQNKAFRESLRRALIKNDYDANKVGFELKSYISVLKSHVKVGQEIVDLISGKKEQLKQTLSVINPRLGLIKQR